MNAKRKRTNANARDNEQKFMQGIANANTRNRESEHNVKRRQEDRKVDANAAYVEWKRQWELFNDCYCILTDVLFTLTNVHILHGLSN